MYASVVVVLAGIALWGLSMSMIFESEHREWSLSLIAVLSFIEIVRILKKIESEELSLVKILKCIFK